MPLRLGSGLVERVVYVCAGALPELRDGRRRVALGGKCHASDADVLSRVRLDVAESSGHGERVSDAPRVRTAGKGCCSCTGRHADVAVAGDARKRPGILLYSQEQAPSVSDRSNTCDQSVHFHRYGN